MEIPTFLLISVSNFNMIGIKRKAQAVVEVVENKE